jgi:hypothetical protein
LLSSRRFADLSLVAGMLIFVSFQALNLLRRAPELVRLPPWALASAKVLQLVFAPLMLWAFPGVAARSVAAAGRGDWPLAAGLLALLALQAGLALWLAGLAARRYYDGELDSGGSAPQRARQSQRGSRQTARSWLAAPVGALFHRERLYLWRDPLLKILFSQTIFGGVITMVMLAIVSGMDSELQALQDLGFGVSLRSILLFTMAALLSLTESAVLMNKLGVEGALMTVLLLSPASRLSILRAKSLLYLSHFAAVNVPLVITLGLLLHVPALHTACAALLVAANTVVVDAIGSLMSVYFPFTYRRQGRALRPMPAQAGCGYMLLYTLAMQGCNLAALPGAAALIAFTILWGWPGLLLGALIALALAAALNWLLPPQAARLLLQREPELLTTLAKSTD